MGLERLSTGVDIYHESHGKGEPLVLIPSTAFSGDVWLSDQVPELSKFMRVIIHDPRGIGRSTHASGVYTIDLMANDVVALMDHLNISSAHVLGHSMGGRIALSMAQNFPGRVKSLIMAASGSGPAGRSGPDCVSGMPHRLILELVEMGFEKYIYHEIVESDTFFTLEFRKNHPDRVEAFYKLLWPTHAKLKEYINLCIARSTWEGTHRLGDVRVPTLIVVGDKDEGGSSHVEQAEVLAKRIPGAKLKILNGQSHGFFWQVPQETNAWILEWVRKH